MALPSGTATAAVDGTDDASGYYSCNTTAIQSTGTPAVVGDDTSAVFVVVFDR